MCGSCSSDKSCPAMPPLLNVPSNARSIDEAFEMSLKSLLSVLRRPYGYTVESLAEQICGFAQLGARAPTIIDDIVWQYISYGDWQAAQKICRAAGRELNDTEKRKIFETLKGFRKDRDGDSYFGHWMEFVDESGYPDDDTIAEKLKIPSRLRSDHEQILFRKIVMENPRPKIIKAALANCAYQGWADTALSIVKSCVNADISDKDEALRIVFAKGAPAIARQAVNDLYGRDLLPAEILNLAKAVQGLAEKKRAQTQQSYEAED